MKMVSMVTDDGERITLTPETAVCEDSFGRIYAVMPLKDYLKLLSKERQHREAAPKEPKT
jgi:hypothetical protein